MFALLCRFVSEAWDLPIFWKKALKKKTLRDTDLNHSAQRPKRFLPWVRTSFQWGVGLPAGQQLKGKLTRDRTWGTHTVTTISKKRVSSDSTQSERINESKIAWKEESSG